ncbi:XP_029638351.1uncharacterized protein LOC115213491 [Octopus vulgaris]|uniref:XP_029638351.1uncharacterized protein LOC115213491 n=1 Tax=Octopus vulgaris TaxID=6645 RepID=A0AA36F798_OCTVU|nr:XP_029638351.1uncharacterized protein LOC115213491 [Octopus vulgaris]
MASASKVSKLNGEVGDDPLCKNDTGLNYDPQDCGRFIPCFDGASYPSMPCQKDLHFSIEHQRCMEPEENNLEISKPQICYAIMEPSRANEKHVTEHMKNEISTRLFHVLKVYDTGEGERRRRRQRRRCSRWQGDSGCGGGSDGYG